jgi:hypothetical protein
MLRQLKKWRLKMKKWYNIDENNSDEEYLYIDMTGIGTIQIKKDDEGIIVNIFPLNVAEESVASCYAFYNELIPKKEK